MKRFITLFLFSILLFSCDDAFESNIPSMRVSANFNTYTTDPELATPGGYKRITKINNEAPYIGFGGLLVVRGFIDNAVFAYDLACPVERKQTVRLEMKDDVKLCCPECGSEYDGIFYGNTLPSSGKAKEQKLQIRRYATSCSDNMIYVRN